MNINWNNCTFSLNFRKSCNGCIRSAASSAPLLRSTVYGVGKAVAAPLSNIVQAVESIFKGLTQIFGAVFKREFKVSTGLALLVGGLFSVAMAIGSAALIPAAIPYYAYWYNTPSSFTFSEQ